MRVEGCLFLRAGFRATGIVRLMGAKVSILADDAACWPAQGNLQLDGFVYTAIAEGPINAKARLAWLARQTSTPFRPQPYQQLGKVLRESGHEAEAKRVLIAKEKARRKYGDLGWWAKRWNWLLGATIAHGYRPGQALLWAAFWIVFGGILFGIGYHKEIVIPAKAEAYDTSKKTRQETAFYPAFRPLLYSLDTFVPIVNFGQKDYWGPQVACNRSLLKGGSLIRLCVCGTRALYLYRWVHIVFGWGLITLFVAGFTNLVRKE
jgi:hypothetical protein